MKKKYSKLSCTCLKIKYFCGFLQCLDEKKIKMRTSLCESVKG